jgi:hypothetical protein
MRSKIQKIIFSRNPNNSSPSFSSVLLLFGIISAIGSVLMVWINLMSWEIYQKFGTKFIKFLLIVFGFLFIGGIMWIIGKAIWD